MNKKNIMLLILAFAVNNSAFGAASPRTDLAVPVAQIPKEAAVPKPAALRSIKIKADIDPKELGYKKFFSTYYPDTLKIRANGKEVYALTNKDKVEAKEITIPVDGDKVVVEYEYEWDMGKMVGKRTGTKRAEFKVNDKVDKLELEFGSWNKDNRIVIPHASQVGKEEKIK